MFKKILLAIGLLVIFSFIFLTLSKQPEPFPEGSVSEKRVQAGKYEVEEAQFVLRDESRVTQAHDYSAGFAGLPYRQLPVTVWSPKGSDAGRRPLLIYTHGLMSDRNDLKYIAQHLSSYGYVVVAADYPLTSRSSGEALFIADVVNQPGDIAFLISQITDAETEIGTAFGGLVDPDRLGLFGYSLGGLTSTLAAYHPTAKLPQVNAVASIAGPSAMLGERFFRTGEIPFMMLAGTADGVVPYDDHAKVIAERVDNSILVSIDGGSHMGFAGIARYMRWLDNPDSLMCNLMNSKMESLGLERGAEEKSWYPLMGSPGQGIIYDDSSVACAPDGHHPVAINPIKQQMLSMLATLAFFDSLFADTKVERDQSKQFLLETLSRENAMVKVEGEFSSVE
jgi:pimeloyl-ACP methyl ester carboxylesterase